MSHGLFPVVQFSLLIAGRSHLEIWEHMFDHYLWPPVAFWAFDYLLRFMRLLVLNYKVTFGRHTKAVVDYNAERDIIRIYLTPSYHKQPRAGTHYFLYFPTMLKTVGNHPFSLSGWTVSGGENVSKSMTRSVVVDPEKLQSDAEEIQRDPEKIQSVPAIRTKEEEVGSETNSSQTSIVTKPKLHFVIRPYKGLTAGLKDAVMKTGTGSKEMTVLVEGPYGQPHPVLAFDTVLFIVGGSGVAAALSYIQEWLRPRPGQIIRTKHMHLAWAVREYSFARDILDNELAVMASAAARGRVTVKLDFYITGATPAAIKGDALDLDRFDNVEMRISYQRPVADILIRQEAAEAVGSLAVLVCGPAQMADDARRAAVQVVGGGFDRLEYFEEQFGW